MKSNLDVWNIQNYPNEIISALSNVKDGLNIIYSNVYSRLIIGNKTKLYLNLDSLLYNEESDVLVLIMKESGLTKDDIINYLVNNNKRFVEITFNVKDTGFNPLNLKELWFARELSVLEDALKDSVDKSDKKAIFYPNKLAQLNLGYNTKFGDCIELDGRLCKGVLEFNDKIVLLINQKANNYNKEFKIENIVDLLKKYNMNFSILFNAEPNIYLEEDSKKYSLKKTYPY